MTPSWEDPRIKTGMAAQLARAEVLVENLANAETTRTPEGGPYHRKDVVFASATSPDEDAVDLTATDALRATLREQRALRELIDRGPGYQSMTTRKA